MSEVQEITPEMLEEVKKVFFEKYGSGLSDWQAEELINKILEEGAAITVASILETVGLIWGFAL